MKVACPTCGADVEFRYDDSFVRVCDSCRNAVLRTDRGLETLGKVADLAPIDSALTLFATGTYQGRSFVLTGLAQIEHAKGGLWQEWYARFDDAREPRGGVNGPASPESPLSIDDRWGWLAEAQGKLYLTFARPLDADLVPAYAVASPGARLALPGEGDAVEFTVSERGEATYRSASGELPYRLVPSSTFRFADLATADDRFATIDYGGEGDAPGLYVGRQVTLADLKIASNTAIPTAEAAHGKAARLACPNCGGSLELRAPDQTLRVGCPFCASLIDVSGGKLAVLTKLNERPALAIALGSKGTFVDGELTVIGYLQRSAHVDDAWYPFYEYLLYAPAVGFRWLVSSDGHWSYVQPVSAAAVEEAPVRYQGVEFERFAGAQLRVDAVYGECYWKVAIGDQVIGEDFIAPPAMLSKETDADEITWSLSSYLTPADVRVAFAQPKLGLPPPIGVGPNQPSPWRGVGLIALTAFVLLGAFGIGKVMSSPGTTIATLATEVQPPPPAGTTESTPTIAFSDPFHVDGARNLEIGFTAPSLDNNYLYAAVDLVNDATGVVVSIDQNIERYSGVEDGESWSEGDRTEHQILAPIPGGDYTLRVEAQTGAPIATTLAVTVRQGVFNGRYLWIALGLGLAVFGLAWLAARQFEIKRRVNASPQAMSTSSERGKPSGDD